jgi:hypothetical protein
VLFGVTLLGASAASSCGSIKLIRHIVIGKMLRRELAVKPWRAFGRLRPAARSSSGAGVSGRPEPAAPDARARQGRSRRLRARHETLGASVSDVGWAACRCRRGRITRLRPGARVRRPSASLSRRTIL